MIGPGGAEQFGYTFRKVGGGRFQRLSIKGASSKASRIWEEPKGWEPLANSRPSGDFWPLASPPVVGQGHLPELPSASGAQLRNGVGMSKQIGSFLVKPIGNPG